MGRHLCSLYKGVPPTQDYSLYKYGSRRVCDLCVWRSASLPRSCHFLTICTELMLNPPPPPHYSHLPFPLTSLNRGTVLSRLKDTIKAEISRPEIQKRLDNRNKSKAQGIRLGEFEHNSMAIRSSFEIFHLVKNRFSHLKAIFYRINGMDRMS